MAVEGGSPGMLRRPVAAALPLLVLLAGCSSPPAEEAAPSPTTAFTSTATLSLLPGPEPTSDTMYLLDAPHMQAAPPAGPTVRAAVPSLADQLQASGGAEAEWTFPRDQLRVLEGNLTFWVEVRGSVLNPNVPFGGGTSCFWTALLLVKDGNASSGVGNCADEPNVVPEGVREIRIGFGAADIGDVVGDTLAVRLSNSGVYSGQATVEVLAGSPEHASRLALRGLSLPLDTQTYL